MERLFAHVPEATFCFDIGHARQIDPTMQEARAFLTRLGARLRQIHMSYVNTNSLHEPLNYECYEAFSRVLRFLDPRTPVILETPVAVGDIERELDKADAILRSRGKKPINTGTNCWTASTNGPLSASSCERRG